MKKLLTRVLPGWFILLFAFVAFTTNAQTTTLIPANAVFKYLDNGSNQGTNWRQASFNDATWPQGAAELGFGDNPATRITSGKLTYYFRKTVSISNPSQYSSLTLKVRRDDGIVVYVNGTEVYRNNMPSGTIAYSTRASSTCSDDGSSVLSATLASTLFINGNNVIAAEVHNRSTSSSDVTFELQLIGNSTIASTCGIPDVNQFGTLNKTATSASPYWIAVAGATSYNVEYRIRNVGAAYSAPISTSTTALTITGLQASTNYEFIVQSVCPSGTSAFSQSGWFSTIAGTSTACDPPAGLGVSNMGTTSATLNWNVASSATAYKVQYRKSGTTTWTLANASTNSLAISEAAKVCCQESVSKIMGNLFAFCSFHAASVKFGVGEC